MRESESPPAAPPSPSGTRVGVVVVGGMVVVVLEVGVVVVAGRVVGVVAGTVVVVVVVEVLVVVVEVLVVVVARVVVVVGRVVVVVARVVVVAGGAVVVVAGGAVVVVVAGATTLTVKEPLPPPASKSETEYDPGAALAATCTLTWHEPGVPGQLPLTTVSGDDAPAPIPPTSLVTVVETVRRSPASTVADPGLTPVIAAFAGSLTVPTTTSNNMPASTSLATLPVSLCRTAITCGLLSTVIRMECIDPSSCRHS